MKEKQKVIPRPEPKNRNLTKEEKKLYKELDNDFTYVANLTNVIEEKTMDPTITDLTLSELHVVECVNKFNNKKMSIIAHELNVTVGSLITCVNRLVGKDYLIKTPDEVDHRIVNLSVTQKAKKVLKSHDKFHHDILMMLTEKVSMSQSVKVLSALREVLDNYMYPKPKQTKKAKKNAK